MATDLPYAADAQVSLSYDELEVLRSQYQKELAQSHVTVQTKFNYAWGLVKSPVNEHQVEGVRLLQDIYRTEPSRRRECLYYIALGYYKMGNYEDAKSFNDLLLEKEPTNLQAQSLSALIERGVTREGYVGMALAGGAVALGTLVLAGIIRRATRKLMQSCVADVLFVFLTLMQFVRLYTLPFIGYRILFAPLGSSRNDSDSYPYDDVHERTP
ncbi:hypothetical protein EDC04DRAFT_2583687 [Pisolithus marmoratus]|nr:hypothetical protein EDC04DRAFT_2583687 [Pisolithus marmoratus]